MDGAKFSEGLLAIAEELRGLTATARLTADLAAPKISQNVQDEFTAGTSPTGDTWAPLKSGGASHLDKTGSMRSKLQVTADGLVVRGKLYAPANIHQYGSKRGVPARPLFPMPDKPLPDSWDASLTEAASEAFAQLTPKMQAAK